MLSDVFAPLRWCVLASALAAALPLTASAAPAPGAAQRPAAEGGPQTTILAVVNGDVITNADVQNRARLFALSTGIPVTQDTITRLRPQIARQLIEERLRLQEMQRRKIVVQDKQIAGAIREIEQRNNMPAGVLASRLSADGASMRTLIDQIRTQIGWTQVLRQQLGERVQPTPTEVEARLKLQTEQSGKTEYRLFEIFIPVEDPAHAADAQRFAELVVNQLHSGAAFPIVAAQFSQSQNALQGGDLGWLQENRIEPDILKLAQQMPLGAVSNPQPVPGGLAIVQLAGKRELGNEMATMVAVRQVFLPFNEPLNPQQPSEQQRQQLEKAKGISASIHSCDAMEQAAAANKSPRPANPGDIRLERVTPPAFRDLLAKLPYDRATQPLVSADGIAVIIVCSREQKNVAQQSQEEIAAQMLNERVELLSRQMLRDLRRRATIEQRNVPA